MARNVTDKAWRNYTKRLEAQRVAAYDDAYEWIMKHRGCSRKELLRMMVEASMYHGRSTSAIAASWFDQMAEAEGADVVKAMAVNDPAQVRAWRMSISANQAYKRHSDFEQIASALASAVAADVKRQATNTMLRNAERTNAEFVWIPSGSGTCGFCIALASNGWQPAKKATALGNHAEHIHDHCRCEFAVRFDKNTQYSSYDESKYKSEYENAEGSTPEEKINSMRRGYYAEHADEITERQRELYAARS